jgi:hypothetical protein
MAHYAGTGPWLFALCANLAFCHTLDKRFFQKELVLKKNYSNLAVKIKINSKTWESFPQEFLPDKGIN